MTETAYAIVLSKSISILTYIGALVVTAVITSFVTGVIGYNFGMKQARKVRLEEKEDKETELEKKREQILREIRADITDSFGILGGRFAMLSDEKIKQVPFYGLAIGHIVKYHSRISSVFNFTEETYNYYLESLSKYVDLGRTEGSFFADKTKDELDEIMMLLFKVIEFVTAAEKNNFDFKFDMSELIIARNELIQGYKGKSQADKGGNG